MIILAEYLVAFAVIVYFAVILLMILFGLFAVITAPFFKWLDRRQKRAKQPWHKTLAWGWKMIVEARRAEKLRRSSREWTAAELEEDERQRRGQRLVL